ncbi:MULTISPECIES: RNA polymerase sigma factor RpoH [Acidithiobacillus]|jgi:RNA polymerase sigma-32 factor|uniref:RNA polymerase sigma factor RpoH n=3 Tax=Acidithiobacillus caldus TaxID=33059 RepID=F9ZSY2_ACICS|nr:MULTISPECIES: RNA polymerase sigma factor RpoH [Acidithiobacillus]AEK57126.1 RNA polymerase sigma factor RpoH [Acidithiobacillus caldus SM-1]AIA54389.1 RNA polymerase sigma factor RpoH [Acidithiobacillus caldus ATCC 51756]AUW31902.1 RNA polymerase sigma factor RpoH [Acidithiobacillus caldus]MBU2728761.1 RNA polymerase sigma factor RpoH [Acidithiobacillus caldus]MBU2734742.1 RNA polymerase sigma factor RpoH [Acidithiobacillus caldus ATCC 51756]
MNDLVMTQRDLATVDGMAAYLRFVHAQPVLSVEEERRLARRLRDEDDVDAAKQLVLSHLRFVVRVARAYRGYGLPEADLIQEGNIGLMKAVKRFDPEQGVRLVSFAVHWIKAEMHEFILRNWRIVKVATTKAQRKLFFNLRSARQSSGWLGQEESAAIAEDLGVSQEAVLEMEGRMAGQDYSLQYESDDEEGHGRTLELEDPGESSVEALIDRDWDQQRQRGLRAALQSLSERDRYIIQNRWLSDDPKTLQALGEELGVSAERVRQLEKSGMEKLRSRLLEYVPA